MRMFESAFNQHVTVLNVRQNFHTFSSNRQSAMLSNRRRGGAGCLLTAKWSVLCNHAVCMRLRHCIQLGDAVTIDTHIPHQRNLSDAIVISNSKLCVRLADACGIAGHCYVISKAQQGVPDAYGNNVGKLTLVEGIAVRPHMSSSSTPASKLPEQ